MVTTRAFPLLCVAIGLITALYAIGQRFRVEQRNRAVELAIDANDAQALADSEGLSLAEVLERFRKVGVTSVAVSEETLVNLRDAGKVVILPATAADGLPPPFALKVFSTDARLLARIAQQVTAKFPIAPQWWAPRGGGEAVLALPNARAVVAEMGLGVDAMQVEAAQRAGLRLIARLKNYPSLNRDALAFMIDEAKKVGASSVVCAEDEVLGYRDLIEEAAQRLREAQLNYGTIEFAKQKGDALLAREMQGRVVRVHSIMPKESLLLSPSEAVERFVRAAQERNVRLCYLRPLPQLKKDALQDNLRYVQALSDRLRRVGLTPKPSRPFGAFEMPFPLLLLMSLGVIGGALLLLECFTPVALPVHVGLTAIGLVLSSFALQLSPLLAVKLLALAASGTFPTLAFAYSPLPQDPTRPTSAVFRLAFFVLLRTSAITLVGALLIAGLLAHWRFMTQTDQFMGIKASQLIPVLLIAVIYIGGLFPHQQSPWHDRWRSAREKFQALLDHPLFVKYALLGAVMLLGGLLWIARTGNEPGVGVSEWELRFRSLLERVLIARPRTKEFLLGHPALLLAAFLAARGEKRYVIPLLLIGAIGQTSLLNTFCHIHTPLHVSLLRTFNGLWLGAGIGGLICLGVG
ncbi:MAG: DUF5693 family protein, partial [Abditibacteriales bacterium]|nr:DUF5693 family protein [Abditibacteriales bacterium]MDW8368292.1 DUF5693 family protein [Abditibacteriales bacterium]